VTTDREGKKSVGEKAREEEYAFVSEKARETECACVCEKARETEGVCVSEKARDRKKEREGVSVYPCV
jgi:hypothetical protein